MNASHAIDANTSPVTTDSPPPNQNLKDFIGCQEEENRALASLFTVANGKVLQVKKVVGMRGGVRDRLCSHERMKYEAVIILAWSRYILGNECRKLMGCAWPMLDGMKAFVLEKLEEPLSVKTEKEKRRTTQFIGRTFTFLLK
jgi:hypothetical protein